MRAIATPDLLRTVAAVRMILVVTLLWIVVAVADAAGSPNVVIFLTDDHSQRDSTPYGARDLRTPNMQRLADAGLTFTRAFVASPSCAPSRAALLTGLMPARNGAEPNHSKPRPEVKKWPAYLHELGYEAVAFGKVAHYKHAVDYGFDHFAHDTFHDHAGIAAAVDFLKRRDNKTAKPLCLFVGSNWPHVPWPTNAAGYEPSALPLPAGSIDTAETRHWRARYAAAVTKADEEFGIVYDAAQRMLGTNTIFVFSGDHGAQWPFAKWNLYDAGIRVPLIVAWPGRVKPGTRTDAMVSWVDLLPTILDALGGREPPDIDGRSFLPVVLGKSSSHRQEIFTTHSGDGGWNIYPTRSVRTADWKYILNLHPEFAFTTHIDLPGQLGQRAYWSTWEAAARTNDRAASIVKRYHARPSEELYNLTDDPDEQRNLADDARHAGQLKHLRAQLEAWMRSQGDRQTVFDTPRLLAEPMSFGPKAANHE
jgi:N-sulfoglucosamine sulfohydrolase